MKNNAFIRSGSVMTHSGIVFYEALSKLPVFLLCYYRLT